MATDQRIRVDARAATRSRDYSSFSGPMAKRLQYENASTISGGKLRHNGHQSSGRTPKIHATRLFGGGILSVKIEINTEMLKAVEAIPLTLRNGPLGRCLGSYAKPIAQTAGSLATSSRATGSRLKWSKKFKDNAAFQNDSKKHFSHKVLRSAVGVYIGATYPQGLKQQFVMPSKKGESYTQYRWGKPGQVITTRSRKGTTYTYTRGQSKNARKNAATRKNPTVANYPNAERATVKAFRQSSGSAESAFLDQLNKEIKELRIG